MNTIKNIIPFFILIVLIVVVIFLLMPKKTITFDIKTADEIYGQDYRISEKYHNKILDIINSLELEKEGRSLTGKYRYLYIKDNKVLNIFYVFEDGKIFYRKDKVYYSVVDQIIANKLIEIMRIYDVNYLNLPLFSVKEIKDYMEVVTDHIIQQIGNDIIQFTFNRDVKYISIFYNDRQEIDDTCVNIKGEMQCDYEYIEKRITSQNYKLLENETLYFKFDKSIYQYGLRFEFTDLNDQISEIKVNIENGEIKFDEVKVKEE